MNLTESGYNHKFYQSPSSEWPGFTDSTNHHHLSGPDLHIPPITIICVARIYRFHQSLSSKWPGSTYSTNHHHLCGPDLQIPPITIIWVARIYIFHQSPSSVWSGSTDSTNHHHLCGPDLHIPPITIICVARIYRFHQSSSSEVRRGVILVSVLETGLPGIAQLLLISRFLYLISTFSIMLSSNVGLISRGVVWALISPLEIWPMKLECLWRSPILENQPSTSNFFEAALLQVTCNGSDSFYLERQVDRWVDTRRLS